MSTILAILLMTVINMNAADLALSDPIGKCGYFTNSRGQQIPNPCGN